jgi:hypothetical protein
VQSGLINFVIHTPMNYDTNLKSAEEEEGGGSHDSAVIREEEDAPNLDIDFHEDATTFYASPDGIIVSDTSRTAAADLITTNSFRDFRIVLDGVAIDCKFPERHRSNV